MRLECSGFLCRMARVTPELHVPHDATVRKPDFLEAPFCARDPFRQWRCRHRANRLPTTAELFAPAVMLHRATGHTLRYRSPPPTNPKAVHSRQPWPKSPWRVSASLAVTSHISSRSRAPPPVRTWRTPRAPKPRPRKCVLAVLWVILACRICRLGSVYSRCGGLGGGSGCAGLGMYHGGPPQGGNQTIRPLRRSMMPLPVGLVGSSSLVPL